MWQQSWYWAERKRDQAFEGVIEEITGIELLIPYPIPLTRISHNFSHVGMRLLLFNTFFFSGS